MISIRPFLLSICAICAICGQNLFSAEKPNVLLLLVDDLKPALGCYGDTHAVTPHIDALAARGIRFDRAHCNQAVCAPSRFTLMLGSHSTSTGLYGLGSALRDLVPDAVTMPQHFAKHGGYRTESLGKVFHIGHGNEGDPQSFSVPHFKDKVIEYLDPASTGGGALTREEALFTNQKLGEIRSLPRGAAFESPVAADTDYADGRVAEETIVRLRAAKKRREMDGTPFFITAGFVRPHLPFSAPKKYWDLYDPAKLPTPEFEEFPADSPEAAHKHGGEITAYKPVPENGAIEADLARQLIHGYYASTSFVDAQIGKVTAALDRLGLTDDTIVVLWGDHGFHLGDLGIWTKHTNYEQANRIPILIAAPGVTQPGTHTKQPAGSVDIFPTLAELAGLPAPAGPQPIDGLSLVPVLKDPSARVRDHTFHAYPKKKLGRAIRTERYRLVEWKNAGKSTAAEYELYDYETDPLETENLAAKKPEVVAELKRTLAAYPDPVARSTKKTITPKPETPATTARAGNRFLRWGDLGDGTYANPVLNGDFADSDVERHGDGWVMITSTNHLSPGMTILESKDLINWRYTGHAIPSLTWEPRYHWNAMNGYRFGTWAGDLVYRDGEWLCYQIDFQSGLYMTRAKDLAGPWSEPVCLLKRKHWTDPAVYFDEATREAWLVCNWGKGSPPRPDVPHEIKLFKLSWDGTELLDEGKTIFSGTAVEAAKIRRFDGLWYIMLIEWQGEGTSRDRKQLCLRSTTESIYGPYESRVVMERESDGDRSACQGSLIEAPDGRWWFLHQLVQNGTPVFHGRPQCLQPVSWDDGWPLIGIDSDGDGMGEPVWTHAKPIPGKAERALQASDEFESKTLGPQWNWNHNPRPDRWSLSARPGWLRLTASKPVPGDRGNLKGQFWGAPNTISQRHLGIGKGRVETRIELSGMKPGTRAGLCHHSGKYALFGVREEPDGRRILFFNNNGVQKPGPEIDGAIVYLRSDTDGDEATFAWSVDGKSWAKTDWRYTLVFGNWRGNRPGLFCWNSMTDDPSAAGYVDIDWFHYDAEK